MHGIEILAAAFGLRYGIGYVRGREVSYKEWCVWVLGAFIASLIYVIVQPS